MQVNQQDSEFESTFDIKLLLIVVRRWAWALILGSLVGIIAGYLVSKYQMPVYEASTTVMITRGPQDKNSDQTYSSSQQLTATYMRLLTARPLMDSASGRLKYTINPDNISVTQVRDTQVIEIKVENNDSSLAMAIANMLVQILIEQNDSLQAGRYAATEASMQVQIEQVQKQIALLNSDIGKLSQQTIQDQIDQVKAQIAPLQDETTQLEKDIVVLNVPYASAEKKAQVVEKQNRIAEIQPILELYQQVYSNLLVLGQSTQGNTQNQSQLTQLKSTLDLYQQIYFNLINSVETTRQNRLENTPGVVQIEPAILPTEPIRPRPLLYTVLAGAAGLILATIVVSLIEYFDDSIKTPEEVQRLFGLNVLGFVSEVSPPDVKAGNLSVTDQPRSPISEAFRSLRANLEFSSINSPLRTIIVTSSEPGEGKSTIAVNLVSILAQGGRRVTLLDADLRRPSVHRFFDLTNRVGLTDLFRGRLNITEVIQSVKADSNISVITSGSLPPNPTELLSSKKMDSIISDLLMNTEIIILDSAPAIVADAQFLSSKVDGVLIVVRPGNTNRDQLLSTLEQLNRAGAKVLGVVFNRIPNNRISYYGGYKQYSPYHYHSYNYHSIQSPVSSNNSDEGKNNFSGE